MINEVLTIAIGIYMPVLLPFVVLLMALMLSERIIDAVQQALGVRRSR